MSKHKNKNNNNNNNNSTERENPDRIYFEDPQLKVYGKDTMLIKTYIYLPRNQN